MTKSEAIAKYNLQEQKKDCFGMPYSYEFYSREETKNGVKTIYTVTQDELAKEEGENIYFLIIEKFYLNQTYINKYGQERVKRKTTIKELTA